MKKISKIVVVIVAVALIISGISIVTAFIIAIDKNTADSAGTIAESVLLVANEESPGIWAGYWVLWSGWDKENSNFCGVNAIIEMDIQPNHYFVEHLYFFEGVGKNRNFDKPKELAFIAFLHNNSNLFFQIQLNDVINQTGLFADSIGVLKYNKTHSYQMAVWSDGNKESGSTLNCYAKDLETGEIVARSWLLNYSWIIQGFAVDVALERGEKTKNGFVKCSELIYCEFDGESNRFYPWTNIEDNNLDEGEWLYREYDIGEDKVRGGKDYINNTVWLGMVEK